MMTSCLWWQFFCNKTIFKRVDQKWIWNNLFYAHHGRTQVFNLWDSVRWQAIFSLKIELIRGHYFTPSKVDDKKGPQLENSEKRLRFLLKLNDLLHFSFLTWRKFVNQIVKHRKHLYLRRAVAPFLRTPMMFSLSIQSIYIFLCCFNAVHRIDTIG